MEVRLIKPEEAVDYLKISAASFIWKFNKDEDKEVEMPVMGAFHEGRLVADELFVLTPDALKGIIGFLRNYDGIVKDLIVKKQYQGSPFACLTDRIDGVTYELDHGYAARIYNLKELLEDNVYPAEHGRFSILSLDDLEQNKGIFDVEYQNGKATVTQRYDGDADISLTPPAAARLLLAGEGHTAQTAVYLDGVEIRGNADDFFRAFPRRATRFTDSFWSI